MDYLIHELSTVHVCIRQGCFKRGGFYSGQKLVLDSLLRFQMNADRFVLEVLFNSYVPEYFLTC